jgi:acetyl esterase/lipase
MREHAEELGVDTGKIFTCGFSAGGHLAASAGILWDRPEVLAAMGDAPVGINRPDGMILCYPVITSGKYAHRGSIANLLGNRDYTEEEGKIFSLECHVKPETPPMFVWHTYSDGGVPVKNATLLMDAYIDNGVPFEAHIFPKGPHGMALANGETWNGSQAMYDLHVAHWIELAVEWINKF